MNALAPIQTGNVEAYRASTDAANLCKEIVVATATNIQGRKYVTVEGWQAIAIAHGCSAGARDVEKIEGGVRAIGEIRRMSDGAIISVAEGFVGEDEETWYGGKNRYGKVLPKRNDYAIRAMAQTRAISRACRSAFAHVVVMMNAGLATTPAEEVPDGGFDDRGGQTVENKPQQRHQPPAQQQSKPEEVISDDQRQILMQLATTAGVDARQLCTKARVSAVKDIPASMFDAAKEWLSGKLKQADQAPQSDDILDDEVPY